VPRKKAVKKLLKQSGIDEHKILEWVNGQICTASKGLVLSIQIYWKLPE
jgi:hypothetical protein